MTTVTTSAQTLYFLLVVMFGVGVGATIYFVFQPLVDRNDVEKRIKSLSVELEMIRRKGRSIDANASTLEDTENSAKYERRKQIVERLNLRKWFTTRNLRLKLQRAGFRSNRSEITFLYFSLICPVVAFFVGFMYIFVFNILNVSILFKFIILAAVVFFGFKLPVVYLTNQSNKRVIEANRAWPDALDLILICVESGMSLEESIRYVGTNLAFQSETLAEEFSVLAAEISYLQSKRTAYTNFADRLPLNQAKAFAGAMIQSDIHGTPVASALRILAKESRQERMNKAEQKSAALSPKLTVPMILFFLPVLFIVIMTPAAISVFKLTA